MSENSHVRPQNMRLKSIISNNSRLEGKVSVPSKITGIISGSTFLTGDIIQENSVIGQIIESKGINGELSAAYTISSGSENELYEGSYTVIPKVEQQMMLTKGKVMLDNVTVHKIPYFEVSNTSGGDTVYIANEI